MKNKYIYIIVLLLTVLICLNIEIQQQTDLRHISILTAQNEALQHDIAALQDTSDQQAQKIKWLNADKESLIEHNSNLEVHIDEVINLLKVQQTKEAEVQKTNRSGEHLTSLGTYTVTAYCSCEKCCGEYAKNRPGGKVYGAAGVELTPGISVAGWLPLGTQIMVDGHEYIVQDRTAKWIREKYDGRIIDIYFNDHEAALEWGRQKKEIFEVAK